MQAIQFLFSSNNFFQEKYNLKVANLSLIDEKLFKFMTSERGVIMFLAFNINLGEGGVILIPPVGFPLISQKR